MCLFNQLLCAQPPDRQPCLEPVQYCCERELMRVWSLSRPSELGSVDRSCPDCAHPFCSSAAQFLQRTISPPCRLDFNTAWSLRQIVPIQNSQTYECWWRYFVGMRIAQHSAHMEEDCTVQVTLPALACQERQLHAIDPRRDARKMVRLHALIADTLGHASGEVTNMSPGGCGLRLTKRLRRGQYIRLMVYPNDQTAAVRIDLAKVTWAECRMGRG